MLAEVLPDLHVSEIRVVPGAEGYDLEVMTLRNGAERTTVLGSAIHQATGLLTIVDRLHDTIPLPVLLQGKPIRSWRRLLSSVFEGARKATRCSATRAWAR